MKAYIHVVVTAEKNEYTCNSRRKNSNSRRNAVLSVFLFYNDTVEITQYRSITQDRT